MQNKMSAHKNHGDEMVYMNYMISSNDKISFCFDPLKNNYETCNQKNYP
jgi:hypothetical protein